MTLRKEMLILMAAVTVSMLGLTVIAPLIPHYVNTMGIGGFGIGALFAAFSLTRVIVTPFIGARSDRTGRKHFICAGLLLYAVVSLLYIPAHTIYLLILVRMLHGFSAALIIPISLAYAGDIAKEGNEGRMISTMLTVIFVGAGLGPLFGGFVHHYFSYQTVFLVLAILGVLAFAVVRFGLPETRKEGEREKSFITFKELLRKDILKVLLIWGVSAPMGKAMILAFLPVVGMKMGITPIQSGLVISGFIIFMGLLQAPIGARLDRISNMKKVFLLFTGTLIIAVGLFFFPGCGSLPALFVAAGVVAVGSAIAFPVGFDIATVLGKHGGMGLVIGLLSTSFNVGNAVTPLLAGAVYDLFNLSAAFYVIAIVILAAKVTCYYFASRWLEEKVGKEKGR